MNESIFEDRDIFFCFGFDCKMLSWFFFPLHFNTLSILFCFIDWVSNFQNMLVSLSIKQLYYFLSSSLVYFPFYFCLFFVSFSYQSFQFTVAIPWKNVSLMLESSHVLPSEKIRLLDGVRRCCLGQNLRKSIENRVYHKKSSLYIFFIKSLAVIFRDIFFIYVCRSELFYFIVFIYAGVFSLATGSV